MIYLSIIRGLSISLDMFRTFGINLCQPPCYYNIIILYVQGRDIVLKLESNHAVYIQLPKPPGINSKDGPPIGIDNICFAPCRWRLNSCSNSTFFIPSIPVRAAHLPVLAILSQRSSPHYISHVRSRVDGRAAIS